MGSPEHTESDSLWLELGHLGSATLAQVGGKALNLGRLVSADFPVPPGFCLTTAAYFLAVPPGLDALATRLDSIGPGHAHLPVEADQDAADENWPGQREDVQRDIAQRARELVATAPVPPAVEAALGAAYTMMGEVAGAGDALAVAVRSSATAEDLPFASFAGQQDSFLDVVGEDAVIHAVRRCWASLWTDRAVAYRSANGISHREVGLAVVVQEMVAAEVAGVMFTANPVTGTRNQTVIDANRGPGQAVVSGAVNTDHFVLDTATGQILDPERERSGSGRVGAVRQLVLTSAQLRGLVSLGEAAQRLFGAPQDLEWVIDSQGEIWLTQSRQITTLYPLPDPSSAAPFGIESEPDPEVRVYLCGTLLQGLTRPITPMGLSVLAAVRNRRGLRQYVSPGLRMYVDVTPLLRNKRGRRALLRMLPLADGRSASLLPELFADPRFSILPRRARTSDGDAPAVRRGRGTEASNSLRLMIGLVGGILRAAVWPEAAVRNAAQYGKRLESELALAEPASVFSRLDHARKVLERAADDLIKSTLPGPAAGYIMLALARALLRGIAAPRELEAVLRGLPHNVTTEMDLELWYVAVRIGGDPASRRAFLDNSPGELAARYGAGTLPAGAQAGVRGFLEKYGHRAVAEIDLGMPRWSEKPDHILGMISNYLRVEDPEQAPDRQFARAAEHAEERIRSLVDRAAARSRFRARLVEFCLRRVRQLSGMRELPKFDIVLVLAEMHRQLLKIGTELAGAGTIAAADDVFFLDLDELRVGLRGGDLKGMVAERRRIYDAELRRRRIPRILLSDGTDVEAAAASPEAVSGALVGTPASAGTVTGRVRVILDPVGAHLEPGEILVAPSTDPGWTPLFMTAGALVMEMGGVISHGAVVAREYGIPAVVGLPDATTRLRTGQTVTVDGAAGTVI